mgnify:CR=1 FL=1
MAFLRSLVAKLLELSSASTAGPRGWRIGVAVPYAGATGARAEVGVRRSYEGVNGDAGSGWNVVANGESADESLTERCCC